MPIYFKHEHACEYFFFISKRTQTEHTLREGKKRPIRNKIIKNMTTFDVCNKKSVGDCCVTAGGFTEPNTKISFYFIRSLSTTHTRRNSSLFNNLPSERELECGGSSFHTDTYVDVPPNARE